MKFSNKQKQFLKKIYQEFMTVFAKIVIDTHLFNDSLPGLESRFGQAATFCRQDGGLTHFFTWWEKTKLIE